MWVVNGCWLVDCRRNNGSLPDCVPFYGHGGLPADPAWSAAYPLISNWVSEYYVRGPAVPMHSGPCQRELRGVLGDVLLDPQADDTVVSEHYDGIKAFMESQIRQLDGNEVLSFARYGDWCSVSDGFNTPCPFLRPDISTFYFIEARGCAALQLLQNMAI